MATGFLRQCQSSSMDKGKIFSKNSSETIGYVEKQKQKNLRLLHYTDTKTDSKWITELDTESGYQVLTRVRRNHNP